MPPETLNWDHGSQEYILISDLGSVIILGTYWWDDILRTYVLQSEQTIPTDTASKSPTYTRLEIH